MQARGREFELPKVHLRINGEKVLPKSGDSWDHVNPATGEVDATIPLADAAAVDDAVRHAHGGVRRVAAHCPSPAAGAAVEAG